MASQSNPKRTSTASQPRVSKKVGGRPVGKTNEAAWRRYEDRRRQDFVDWNHGREGAPEFEPLSYEVSEGSGTLYDVVESNLDDGTKASAPRSKPPKVSNIGSRKSRDLSIDGLAGWADEQPWWIRLPLWQFVIAPLWALKLIIWMFLFGFVLYFATGAGAP